MRFWARNLAALSVRVNGWNSGFDLPNALSVATEWYPVVGLVDVCEAAEDRRDTLGLVATLETERRLDLWDEGREFAGG